MRNSHCFARRDHRSSSMGYHATNWLSFACRTAAEHAADTGADTGTIKPPSRCCVGAIFRPCFILLKVVCSIVETAKQNRLNPRIRLPSPICRRSLRPCRTPTGQVASSRSTIKPTQAHPGVSHRRHHGRQPADRAHGLQRADYHVGAV